MVSTLNSSNDPLLRIILLINLIKHLCISIETGHICGFAEHVRQVGTQNVPLRGGGGGEWGEKG
jgi:hypothetical protein